MKINLFSRIEINTIIKLMMQNFFQVTVDLKNYDESNLNLSRHFILISTNNQ
jgi:hypothetical protein